MKKNKKHFYILGIGIISGAAYGIVESKLDHYAEIYDWIKPIHDFQEFFLPILLGAAFAFGANLFFEQKAISRRLSGEVSTLKSKILANSFASYILHEIRNPIHNLNAVIEKNAENFPDSDKEILERNLKRLTETTDQLKQMYVLSDHLDVFHCVDFMPWMEEFKRLSLDKLLKKSKINFSENLVPMRLNIHPLLLEQCMMLIFDNAIRAAASGEKKWVHLEIGVDPDKNDCASVMLRNSGQQFPAHVLAAKGHSKVKSTLGSGLGLVLVRDLLRHVGGELQIGNSQDYAQVTILLPYEHSE